MYACVYEQNGVGLEQFFVLSYSLTRPEIIFELRHCLTKTILSHTILDMYPFLNLNATPLQVFSELCTSYDCAVQMLLYPFLWTSRTGLFVFFSFFLCTYLLLQYAMF